MAGHYDKERERIEVRVHELERQLGELRATLKTFDWLESSTPGRNTDEHGHGGHRSQLNAQTWSDAIDEVLSDAERPLLVSEIVEQLRERGRAFGPKTRPDVTVRGTIARRKEELGWVSSGRKPRKWRKRKENSE